ncbi:hypothetical protein [Chryseosolibacter indicus]|uniref:Lipocalin-like domain-containing protein n=1 Tax=Chryseosolibacter indicus TaxID=2782351 RepID=A0ABS5VYG4_9BACT|nr:hypothetical protein [Chryseosolibacter indicus]MBT1705905.1 hypothetical protein [Chryseosolibacter indicus]
MKGIKYFFVGLLIIIAGNGFAQDSKERGNTDKSNNRTAGKPKNTDNRVNTDKKTPVKIIEYIPGTWTIEQVLRGKEDVTATDTLAQNQRLEFNREGRYLSYSGQEKIDSGSYRLNEQQAVLYLESEANDRPSEWNVWFDPAGTMTLKMRSGSVHGESFKYIYRRDGTTTTSNR